MTELHILQFVIKPRIGEIHADIFKVIESLCKMFSEKCFVFDFTYVHFTHLFNSVNVGMVYEEQFSQKAFWRHYRYHENVQWFLQIRFKNSQNTHPLNVFFHCETRISIKKNEEPHKFDVIWNFYDWLGIHSVSDDPTIKNIILFRMIRPSLSKFYEFIHIQYNNHASHQNVMSS